MNEMRVKVVKAEYDLRVLKRAICEAIEDLGVNLQKRRKTVSYTHLTLPTKV